MRRGSQLRATSYLVIAVAMAIVLLSLGQTLHIDAAKGFAATAFAPVESVFAGVGRSIRDAAGTVTSIGGLRDENQRLRQQVADLRRQLTDAQQATVTDRELKDSLGLRDSLGIKVVAAEVIARDPEGLSQTITIRAGSKQGLKKGMVALAQHGMVGRVVAVQAGSAQVQLISDPNSPVNVFLASSHLNGTLRVQNGRMEVDILGAPTNVTVPPGEQLVTSGLGGNFPRGLPVAGVVNFRYQPYGVQQVAEAAPLDDLSRLEYVIIDLGFTPEAGTG
jgi:rod shape-determining protein MreC